MNKTVQVLIMVAIIAAFFFAPIVAGKREQPYGPAEDPCIIKCYRPIETYYRTPFTAILDLIKGQK